MKMVFILGVIVELLHSIYDSNKLGHFDPIVIYNLK